MRIKKLFDYFDTKNVKPIIDDYQKKKTDAILKDDHKKDDMQCDHIRMNIRIYAFNISKLLYYVVVISTFAYFLGIIWYYTIRYSNENFDTGDPLT